MGLMIMCGGRRISEHDLMLIPTPAKTETYTPIPFSDLVELTKQRIMREFGSSTELDVALGVNAKDTQLFGVITVLDGDKRLPNVGLRSSHDKSITPGLVAGMTLTVCDNLQFNADFLKIMRKHTGDAWSDLELLIMGGIAKLEEHFNVLDQEAGHFEDVEVDTYSGFEQLGLMAGQDILTSVQFNEAMRYWKRPVVKEYEDRSAWSLYNACTYGLKKGQPRKLMTQYTRLHSFMREHHLSDPQSGFIGGICDEPEDAEIMAVAS